MTNRRPIRIGRTLPPAAAPIALRDIAWGLKGWVRAEEAVREVETEVRAYFGVRHCFAVSSGKAALCLILSALKQRRPQRDEVLIPAFTCYSVPSAVVRAGLKVSLCDIDPETFDFDPRSLAKKLDNPRLLAVVPTHLFGLPADVPRLRRMLRDPEVALVEDAAQAMGGEWRGRKLGTLGDVGFFSLGRGKALSTVEGGIVLTDCDTTARSLKEKIAGLDDYGTAQVASLLAYALVLAFFVRPRLFWLPSALPFLKLGSTVFDPDFRMKRMSGFQAGLAHDWRARLQRLQSGRREAVGAWLEALGPRRLQNPPSLLRLPGMAATAEGAGRLRAAGARKGLGVSAAYPDAVAAIDALAAQFAKEAFPAAAQVARRLVTLPVHPFVTGDDRKKILELLSHVEMQWPLSA